VSELVDRITAVLDAELDDLPPSIRDWINTRELAERIVAELGLTAVRCADERWWSTRIERGVY
jgi:hypothetical protein